MNAVRLLGLWLLAGSVCFAAEAPDDERYRALLYELRCLVCQNQTLADSNAELAGDLRRRVRILMDQGLSDAQIFAHLQARYGDFVLYRPPLAWRTAALWAGPFLLLLLAAGLLLRRIRRRHAQAPDRLSETEQRRLRSLLDEGRD